MYTGHFLPMYALKGFEYFVHQRVSSQFRLEVKHNFVTTRIYLEYTQGWLIWEKSFQEHLHSFQLTAYITAQVFGLWLQVIC